MSTAAVTAGATLPLPGGREGGTVRLHPLLCATASAPPGFFSRHPGRFPALHGLGFRVPRETWVNFPISAFIVEHPGFGPVLIDTGLHPSVVVDPKQNLGRIGAFTFKDLDTTPTQTAAANLRERNFDPAEVGLVLMTHLHADHASAMSEFPDATFLVSRQEWQAANSRRAIFRGYTPSHWDHALKIGLLDFDGARTESFASFGRSLDIFGDGSVRAVFTPGHTPGHVSFVLRLSGREALICGDAAFTTRAIDERLLPWLLADKHNYLRSLQEISIYRKQTPGALIIPGHDAQAWASLSRVY